MKNKKIFFTLTVSAALAGCGSTATSGSKEGYKSVQNISKLKVSFADSIWNGKKVPKGQECKWAGGNGSTPRLIVKNIPSNTNALIVEFSDRSYSPMDSGGHGKIGIRVSNKQSSITIPSVLGETKALPKNMFIVKEHRGYTRGNSGAYLPPCSGGKGNSYYATIKAVTKVTGKSKILGSGKIEMGRY